MPRSTDYIGATGIGVSDLEASARFYEAALGMTRLNTIDLPHMDEIILVHEARNAVVLMHWTDGSERNYANLPIKLVFQVADASRLIEGIRADGLEVTTEPAPFPGMGGAIIGLAKDPDGYVVELIQMPVPATVPA